MPLIPLYLPKPTLLKMTKSSETKKGTIKFYNEQKGYGFIVNSATGEEVFFHRSRVKTELTRKDQDKNVTFTEFEGKKGIEAENVSID